MRYQYYCLLCRQTIDFLHDIILALHIPGVLANIASVLGNNDVSIAQVVQKSRKGGVAELVIITDEVEECNFNDAMAIFKGMSVVSEISGVIRVY